MVSHSNGGVVLQHPSFNVLSQAFIDWVIEWKLLHDLKEVHKTVVLLKGVACLLYVLLTVVVRLAVLKQKV